MLVYSFDDPYEQLDAPNKLKTDCIDQHARLVKTKFIHPLAPWMKKLGTAESQWKRDNYLYPAHHAPIEEYWTKFRNVRNELKNKTKKQKLPSI